MNISYTYNNDGILDISLEENDVDSSQMTSNYSNNGIVTISRKVNAGTYYLKVESGEDCAQGYKLISLSN